MDAEENANGRNGRNGIVSVGESQATCLPLDNYNVLGCLRRSNAEIAKEKSVRLGLSSSCKRGKR